MPKKYMNDFQRVKAGNWLENQKAWIATDPSIQVIADAATGELGHRVTGSFVKSYLQETEWFSKMRQKVEPVSTSNIQTAVALTLEVLEKIMANSAIDPDQIQSTIRMAKSLITTTETEPREPIQLDLINEEIMRGGHA